ncbi:MAG: response regulator transcription factor [Meiothermus sp.]|nr:response regulator transcription factor [Meiothermus sp.]
MKPRVLIVEDEAVLASVLADNLEGEGMSVEIAPDGLRALELWQMLEPDLVVLDVMLSKLDGFEVCRRMRAVGFRTSVLFLSARAEAEDRVEGLEAGGDDYITKPFHLPEFMLRVQNTLRRQQWFRGGPDQTYGFAGHRVDFRTWSVTLADGRTETLGERELMIFKLLSERAGEVVSRDQILDRVWGNDIFPSSRTVDNFIVRLRRLFEPDPSRPVHLHTVWGVGYRFTPEPEAEVVSYER